MVDHLIFPLSCSHLLRTPCGAQVAKFTRLNDMSETSSQAEAAPVPELPRLHPTIASSMFFC
uniref:Uncharacterized protein n=1 Tax=Aegilops tauschii subsp. strangulata TaxID=200361 RepID=A0A453EQJ6_AEGTS